MYANSFKRRTSMTINDLFQTYNDIRFARIGHNITLARKANNMTAKQAADALGISMEDFFCYEYGGKELPVDLMYKFAKLYKVNVEYFVKGLENITFDEVVEAAQGGLKTLNCG